MSRQSQSTNMKHSGVYLYALNQSMLGPLWKGAGMPQIKVPHGSDTNYIFNGLFPEGQVSEEDEKLSREFAVAFINFANSGNPNRLGTDGSGWPQAFSQDGGTASVPHLLNLQVVGGPYGTGPALLGSARSSVGDERERVPESEEELKVEQQILPGISIRAMSSPSARLRKTVVDREQLLRRCAFLNSLTEKLGI